MNGEPDLAGLRALALVAEEGSISGASRRLNVSQQAVSLRIRALEAQLGVRLLSRSPRGSQLSPTGILIVEWAADVLHAADSFADAVTSLRAAGTRAIRIAASLTIAEYLVPGWIAAWRGSVGADGAVAQLQATNSQDVIARVRSGEVELGFIETPDVPHDLGSVVVGTDTVEIVIARDHPWDRAGAVTLAELTETPLVVREAGSGTRRALEAALEARGLQMHAEPALTASTTLAVRSAVMAGVGPAALSSLAVRDDVAAGRLVTVTVVGLTIRRLHTAIWLGKTPPPLVRDFLRVVSEASA